MPSAVSWIQHITDLFTCRKPIIGAINGFAMGGGAEMVVNLDMAIAGQSATLGFPEAKRGVTVGAGGIPRLVRLVGHTRGRLHRPSIVAISSTRDLTITGL